MHMLIVVAHHQPSSLTHAIASQIGEGVKLADRGHTIEQADLFAEGFDPVFTAADHAVHLRQAAPPAQVQSEQARIDRADAIVLVFPVYWWSMPALMKGWIDRVFINGWAFEFGPDIGFQKKLGHLQVHLVGIGGADADSWSRHGYDTAMKTQIDHGIFDYCGASVLTSNLLLESETREPTALLVDARAIGEQVAAGRVRSTALAV